MMCVFTFFPLPIFPMLLHVRSYIGHNVQRFFASKRVGNRLHDEL